MPRFKDAHWDLTSEPDGKLTLERIRAALLMDLRDELKRINRTLSCRNFQSIPSLLRRIASNTAKKRKPKAKKNADA